MSCPGDETNEEDTSFYAKRRSQLNVIFSVLGTPEEADLRHLDSKSARDIRAVPALSPCNFREKYPGTDKDGLDLLRGLLKFDPAQRLNIDGALAHPFLASVRSEARELEATSPMRDDIETVGEVGTTRSRCDVDRTITIRLVLPSLSPHFLPIHSSLTFLRTCWSWY